MASKEVPSEEVSSINPARRAISILEKNMGAAVGVVVQAIAPVVMNVVANVAANLISNFLSNMLDGAPNAGGADGICSKMQGCESNDLRNAAINSINTMHVDAAKEALNRLCEKLGMPKFLRDEIHGEFDQVLKQNYQACNPATQNNLNDCIGKDVKNKVQNLSNQLVNYVEDILKERLEGEAAGASGSGAKGRISAKSWMAVIAEALGKAQSQQVGKMLELSAKVSNVAERQAQFEDDHKGLDAEDQQAMQDYGSEKSKLGAEMAKAQTDLQAASQEYKLISETTSTLLKNLGEALSGMARKQ